MMNNASEEERKSLADRVHSQRVEINRLLAESELHKAELGQVTADRLREHEEIGRLRSYVLIARDELLAIKKKCDSESGTKAGCVATLKLCSELAGRASERISKVL